MPKNTSRKGGSRHFGAPGPGSGRRAARPLGGIGLLSRAAREFEPEDVELTQAFANQAALAVRNAEILAHERRAGPLQQLLQRSKGLSRRDQLAVEHLLDAAESLIALGERPEAGRR